MVTQRSRQIQNANGQTDNVGRPPLHWSVKASPVAKPFRLWMALTAEFGYMSRTEAGRGRQRPGPNRVELRGCG